MKASDGMNIVTQDDINLLLQKNKTVYSKVLLLNKNLQTVEELEGKVIDISYSIDSTSDIRRTCTLSIVLDKKQTLLKDETLFLDKYIKIYIGILNTRTKEIVYYNKGVYVVNSENFTFDILTSTLTLNGNDIVSTLNGTYGGQLTGLSTTILADTDIRKVIIDTITQLGGITKYNICDIDKKVPYDLEFGVGTTVWEIITTLKDLYSGYESFFDEEGVFIFQKIPTCEEDTIYIDDTLLRPLVINENTSIDYTTVKNVTEVWGKCLESDRYTEHCTYSNGCYNVTIDELIEVDDNGKLIDGTLFGIKVDVTNGENVKININNIGEYPILNEDDTPILANIIESGLSYVFKYKNEKFYYLGQWQIHYIAKEVSSTPSEEYKNGDYEKYGTKNISYIVNSESPFTTDKIGEIIQVCSDGEFEYIYSDDLARQRAEYENWKATRLNDVVSLNMVDIPWLQVNKKVRYTSLHNNVTKDYLIKKINGNSQYTMTIELSRFYPECPFVVT